MVRLPERTADRHGQPWLFPALELDGWWTNLEVASVDADALIKLYQRRGTSGQYHSEFKTDLDLERLPSGKFDTNALVLREMIYKAARLICYGRGNVLRFGRGDPSHTALKRCCARVST